jgi:hypothetical protein
MEKPILIGSRVCAEATPANRCIAAAKAATIAMSLPRISLLIAIQELR